MPTYARAPVEFVRGDGAKLWDSDGKEYLDFFAGLSVHNAGHCHPRIVAAISEQAATLRRQLEPLLLEPAMRLCERLAESSLGGKVFLCNSGTEANECALKLVRKHAHGRGIERPEVVALDHGFHGRTLGALAGTGGSRARTSSARCRRGSWRSPATIPAPCARRSGRGPPR